MAMGFSDVLWVFLMVTALQPILKQKLLEMRRLRLLVQLEKRRGSRVIALVHRQETMSFLGFPLMRYIDVNDSEEVLRAIKLTDTSRPIDLIMHTPGGLVLAAGQIANALRRHEAKVTVFVPHYAMSGGTLIALAADEIVMDHNAVLGPVDPQVGQSPAASVLTVLERKEAKDIDDQTLILADIARKALAQMRTTVRELLAARMPPAQADALADKLARGEAERGGHTLWYHVDPSFTWLPFFRILRLHFGHVPIGRSFVSRLGSTGGYYSRASRRRRDGLCVLSHHHPRECCGYRIRGRRGRRVPGHLSEGAGAPPDRPAAPHSVDHGDGGERRRGVGSLLPRREGAGRSDGLRRARLPAPSALRSRGGASRLPRSHALSRRRPGRRCLATSSTTSSSVTSSRRPRCGWSSTNARCSSAGSTSKPRSPPRKRSSA